MGSQVREATYIGLDIGTGSVGWAVTDSAYDLCRFHGKDMWGVRLFDEADTAAKRRIARVARRRLQRRNQRLALLQEIFATEIEKTDPAFFERLSAARLLPEDKGWKYTLFDDPQFKDRDYHRLYPTIYHLRLALMTEDKAFDVRLVYLALHHILKHRGHFLSADTGNNSGRPDFETVLEDALTCFNEEFAYDEEESEPVLRCDDSDTLKQLLSDGQMRATDKQKQLCALFDVGKNKQLKAWVNLLGGAKAKLSLLFNDSALEDADPKDICFAAANYEDNLSAIEEAVVDRMLLLEKWRALYNWAVLEKLLSGASSLSAAKVALYEQNGKDLAALKAVVRKYGNAAQYERIFKESNEKLANYCALIGLARGKDGKKVYTKGCSHEDFCKFIGKELEKYPADSMVEELRTKVRDRVLLIPLRSVANSILPYQEHRKELRTILQQAVKYLSFLAVEDNEGITAVQKIEALLEFRIPYYVGPLNQHAPNSWFVRKEDGKIYPWNFEQKVNLTESAVSFIRNLTSKCQYIHTEYVLPACSPLYERYCVLNEINLLKVNGAPISVETKQSLYTHVFERFKKPTIKHIVGHLKALGIQVEPSDLSGIDVEGGIKSSLKTTIGMRKVLGEKYTDGLATRIVESLTCFSEDRKILRYKLMDEIGLSKAEYNQAIRIPCSGWGRLSHEFLTHVRSTVYGNDNISILEAMWITNENLMGLLSKRFEYSAVLEKEYSDANKDSTLDEFMDALYLSPSVKRQVRQTVAVVNELGKAIKHAPTKIFIEMARGENPGQGRTSSRKSQIKALYEALKSEEPALYESLDCTADREFNVDKLYLYYMQRGRCMYTGKRISFDELFNKDICDIDHIYPQSKVKDDSLDNRVLVYTTKNQDKNNIYPIKPETQSSQHDFWLSLLHSKLISKEKYYRLTRKTPFDAFELEGFINRQLVETRQSTKAITKLLAKMFPETEIVYVKANLVSDFRRLRKFPKVRDINDLHHANDAYLNIIVGNIYNTRFTHAKHYDIMSNEHTIKLKALLKQSIQTDNVTAWLPGESGSIITVRKVMSKNTPLITVMPYTKQGKLFELTILRADENKERAVRLKKELDTKKYGGYGGVFCAYFMLVEYRDKKALTRALIDVPIYLIQGGKVSNESALAYCQNNYGFKEARIILPMIRKESLIEINGFRFYITGHTDVRVTGQLGYQLYIGHEWECYFKRVLQYVESAAKYEALNKGKAYRLLPRDKITTEQNLALFDLFLAKLQSAPYNRFSNFCTQGASLSSAREVFQKLTPEEQCKALRQVVKLLTRKDTTANLTILGLKASAGVIKLSRNLNNTQSAYLIHQSPTGLYEQTIDLKKV